MSEFFTLDDFDMAGKRVLVRVDINSPIDPETGRILGDTRIRKVIPTLEELESARVAILAHQSRPGKKDFTTMKEHARRLSALLGKRVKYVDDLFASRAKGAIERMKDGDCILLENTRFYSEEVSLAGKDTDTLERSHIVSNLAPLFDYFVNDAFAAAHRAQPSLIGFGRKIPSIAGRLMEKELVGLGRAFSGDRPVIAILGGAKFDDSVEIAENMLGKGIADKVLTTGAVANLFVHASGKRLGTPSERFLDDNGKTEGVIKKAKDVLTKYGDRLITPVDFAVDYKGNREEVSLSELPVEYPILDLGLETIVAYEDEIKSAGTIILNGPAGMFEKEEFSLGTVEIFRAVAESGAYSVAGGGHSIEAIRQLGIEKKIDHISTGGGSAISFLAGRKMPVVEMLKDSKRFFDRNK